MGRFIELRTTTLKAGLSGHFHQLMQGQALPLPGAAGMQSVVALVDSLRHSEVTA